MQRKIVTIQSYAWRTNDNQPTLPVYMDPLELNLLGVLEVNIAAVADTVVHARDPPRRPNRVTCQQLRVLRIAAGCCFAAIVHDGFTRAAGAQSLDRLRRRRCRGQEGYKKCLQNLHRNSFDVYE